MGAAREIPPLSPIQDRLNRGLWAERQHRYPHQCLTVRGRVKPRDMEGLSSEHHYARYPFNEGDQWGFETAEQLGEFQAKFGEHVL